MSLLPDTPAALLEAFRTLNATSPRLSWYGPDGERVEFSGRVLENWVAKTANYLVDELDAEPGQVVALEMPLHWRSMVWLLAGWAVGTTVATGGLPAGAEIVASTDPAAAHGRLAGASPAPLVVAVALPALAMRWTGELPPRTLDYCGDVRSHGDVFFADAEPDGDGTAWLNGAAGAAEATSYGQLLAAAQCDQAPRRVLLQAREGWGTVVPQALKAWAEGGSVVLLGDGVEASDALRKSENITAG